MTQTLTVNLARPLATVRALDADRNDPAPGNETHPGKTPAAQEPLAIAVEAARRQATQEIESQKEELARLCETAANLAAKLDRLYREAVAHHSEEIARLAVEIAGKIVAQKTAAGDYDIQAIIQEALKRAPTQQGITIRVNPDDLARCQQLQQAGPEGALAEISFVADWSIGRADCLIETPKGIVKSFVEEHLQRIGDALAKAK
jgi:flagellar assembly protein FliH